MVTVNFTQNLQRHIECPALHTEGDTIKQVLHNIFAQNPKLGCYVLDDQGQLRKHMTISVDGQLIKDRSKLSDKVKQDSEVYIMQALSGG